MALLKHYDKNTIICLLWCTGGDIFQWFGIISSSAKILRSWFSFVVENLHIRVNILALVRQRDTLHG